MQWDCSWVRDSLGSQAHPLPTESSDFLFTIFTLQLRGYDKESWTCTSNTICMLRLPIVNCDCLGNYGFPRVNHEFTIVPTLVRCKSFVWVDFAHPPFGHPVWHFLFSEIGRLRIVHWWPMTHRMCAKRLIWQAVTCQVSSIDRPQDETQVLCLDKHNLTCYLTTYLSSSTCSKNASLGPWKPRKNRFEID